MRVANVFPAHGKAQAANQTWWLALWRRHDTRVPSAQIPDNRKHKKQPDVQRLWLPQPAQLHG
ncbi:MAG TPA: hypothetical protein G4N95_06195 [Anaerolineae bacterium]|nr:hypothetical protein [Anaerolineae bacterium]